MDGGFVNSGRSATFHRASLGGGGSGSSGSGSGNGGSSSQQYSTMTRSASFSNASNHGSISSPNNNNNINNAVSETGDTSRRRRRLTSEETRVLCDEFEKNQKPSSKTRVKLAMQIPGMTARAIQIWFQNKRAKFKQTRRMPADANPPSSSSSSSPLPKKSKNITKKRNSSSNTSTSPHHHLHHLHHNHHHNHSSAMSSSIRRYASEGELDTLKKEDEIPMQQWLEELSKSSGLNSPTTPNSDGEGFFQSSVLYRNNSLYLFDDFEQTEKKPRSNSAPEISKSDFENEFGNLSLAGLPPLEHYAANLVSEGLLNEEGEFLFRNYRNIPPPPKSAPSDHLYPNLSLNVQDSFSSSSSNSDPSQRMRKTQSVPNINSIGY